MMYVHFIFIIINLLGIGKVCYTHPNANGMIIISLVYLCIMSFLGAISMKKDD